MIGLVTLETWYHRMSSQTLSVLGGGLLEGP